MGDRIRIGVSSCLLGEKVRYDGCDKLDRHVVDVLGERFELVPVCPEVECGLPVPREAMRLEGEPDAPRLATVGTKIDLTERMLSFCGRKMRELERAGLSGFVFKARSPSCGLSGIPVFAGDIPAGTGTGLFAAAFIRHFPLLPAVEECGLSEATSIERFIERLTAAAGTN